jgi:hypothetical protein
LVESGKTPFGAVLGLRANAEEIRGLIKFALSSHKKKK